MKKAVRLNIYPNLLACDDRNWFFPLSTDGFLTRLAIFLAVCCFLESVTPFPEFIPGFGVHTAVPTWTEASLVSLSPAAGSMFTLEEALLAKMLKSAERKARQRNTEWDLIPIKKIQSYTSNKQFRLDSNKPSIFLCTFSLSHVFFTSILLSRNLKETEL